MDTLIEYLIQKQYCTNPLKINIWVERAGFPDLQNYPRTDDTSVADQKHQECNTSRRT